MTRTSMFSSPLIFSRQSVNGLFTLFPRFLMDFTGLLDSTQVLFVFQRCHRRKTTCCYSFLTDLSTHRNGRRAVQHLEQVLPHPHSWIILSMVGLVTPPSACASYPWNFVWHTPQVVTFPPPFFSRLSRSKCHFPRLLIFSCCLYYLYCTYTLESAHVERKWNNEIETILISLGNGYVL